MQASRRGSRGRLSCQSVWKLVQLANQVHRYTVVAAALPKLVLQSSVLVVPRVHAFPTTACQHVPDAHYSSKSSLRLRPVEIARHLVFLSWDCFRCRVAVLVRPTQEGIKLAPAISEMVVSRALQEAADAEQWELFTQLLTSTGAQEHGINTLAKDRTADAQHVMVCKLISEIARNAGTPEELEKHAAKLKTMV